MDRLHQLEVFRRVVETGNITRAARTLNISQPSVSRLVAELEARLGVGLLLRSPSGLHPTEAGTAFYAEAVRVLDALEEAEAAVRGAGSTLAGTLRVAAPGALFAGVVMDWVPEFLAAHPDLTFEARIEDRRIDLVEEGVDLAIRVGPLREASLIARRLGTVDFRLFAAPSYLARAGLPATPAALVDHELCLHLVGAHPETLALEGPEGASASVAVHGRFRTTGLEGVRRAVEAGLGLGLLAPFSVVPAVAAGTLVPVLPGWRAAPREVHAVWPATRAMPRRVRAFLDFLVARCTADPRLRAV